MNPSLGLAMKDFLAKNGLSEKGVIVSLCDNNSCTIQVKSGASKTMENTIYHGHLHDVFEFTLTGSDIGVLKYDFILSDEFRNKCYD